MCKVGDNITRVGRHQTGCPLCGETNTADFPGPPRYFGYICGYRSEGNLSTGEQTISHMCTRYTEKDKKEEKQNGGTHFCNCSPEQIWKDGCKCGGI